jgi:Ca-activated chloride channel homolog
MARLRCLAAATLIAFAFVATGCGSDGRGDAGPRNDGGIPAAPDSAYEGRPDEATGETDTRDDPLSTFAVDVDTASYGYASRLIGEGRRPNSADIRPEEFVNSFDQRYPQPGGDGFAISVDGTRRPAEPRDDTGNDARVMRVGLQTRDDDSENRPDAALTFVVDISGSMAERGRLDLVRDALHTLVDELRPTDAVAVVAFNERPRVIREMTRVADADALHRAVDSLASGGSTNLESGLVTGYEVARDGFRRGATNRVVILSDGLANVGNTDADPILRRVADEAGKQIALLGVGVGSEYGDALMERLADRGDGFVVYVSELAQARDVFVERLPATLTVRALDAKVQVTFDDDAVRSYRLIGYENRAVADEDFRDDRVDGGEVGPGHSVTALYEVRLADRVAASDRVARVQVRWLDPTGREPAEAYESVTVADIDGDFAEARPQVWVCYAAAYFAEALRGGPYARQVRLADLADVARGAYDRTGDAQIRDLAELIDRARDVI